MSSRDGQRNLLDQLADGAPVERMRARFDELIAEPATGRWRRSARLVWAGAALVVIAGALGLQLQSSRPRAPQAEARKVLGMLEASSVFERLRGVNAASGLEESWPDVELALLERLEGDESVNVRLAALDALLARHDSATTPVRLVEALATQETAIVQAHLGNRLRRRQLLTPAELERVLKRPTIHDEARETLERLEES